MFICCCVVSFIFDRSWKKLISSYFIGKLLIYSSESKLCVRNTIESFVLRDVGYRFFLSFLYFQKVVLFHDAQVKVIFGGRKKSTVLCAPIFTEFKISQQHYMQVSCTESYPNQTMKTENTARDLLKFLSKVRLLTRPICGGRQIYETQACLTILLTNSYKEFHESHTKFLIFYTDKTGLDGRMALVFV